MHENPLPVLLLRHGPLPAGALAALHDDPRMEPYSADSLTPDWVSFAQRVAGTVVATEGDPMSALVYAVSGGIKPPIIVAFSERNKGDRKALLAAGAAHCVRLPVGGKDLE